MSTVSNSATGTETCAPKRGAMTTRTAGGRSTEADTTTGDVTNGADAHIGAWAAGADQAPGIATVMLSAAIQAMATSRRILFVT